MQQLGYKEYVTQGGDWGFWITRSVGILYPENAKASHINMILADAPKFSKNPLLAAQHSVSPYTRREKEGAKRTRSIRKEGLGL